MWINEVIERAREALDLPVATCADGDLVAEIERQGVPSCQDARSARSWLQQRLRISGADADARVQVARKVDNRVSPTGEPLPPELPATAAALRDGEIGLDHARTVVTGIRKVTPFLSPQQCEQTERLLVEQSRVLEPRGVQVLAEGVRYHVDPDGAFREEERQFEDRELHFGVGQDGMTVLKGRLDRETGAKLRAVLEPLATPRPETDGEKDPRTAGQRHADALNIERTHGRPVFIPPSTVDPQCRPRPGQPAIAPTRPHATHRGMKGDSIMPASTVHAPTSPGDPATNAERAHRSAHFWGR